MPPFSYAEALFYCIVAVSPLVILTLMTFRGKFRFGKAVTAGVICASVFLYILLTLLYLMADSDTLLTRIPFLLDVITGLLIAGTFLLLIKIHPGELIFYLLVMSNFSNMNVIWGKYIDGLWSRDLALLRYHFTFSLAFLIVEAVLIPVTWFAVFRDMKNLPERPSSKFWNYIWLIPLAFYFEWAFAFYMFPGSALERSLDISFPLFSMFINAVAVLLYRLLLNLLQCIYG